MSPQPHEEQPLHCPQGPSGRIPSVAQALVKELGGWGPRGGPASRGSHHKAPEGGMGNTGAYHSRCSLEGFLEVAVRARLGVREGRRGTHTCPGLNAALELRDSARGRGHGRG